MSIIYPEGTSVQGNIKAMAVLSVANMAAPDLSSEIGAVTSLDLSLFLRDWNPEVTSNSGSAPPRLGTTVQLPVEGNTQFAAIPIRYVYDPQAADSADENKAKALLVRGTEVYFVIRKGLDAQLDAFTAGEYVEVWKFITGRQNFLRSGDDEFSEFEISQLLYPQVEPEYDGQIVA